MKNLSIKLLLVRCFFFYSMHLMRDDEKNESQKKHYKTNEMRVERREINAKKN